MRELLQDVAAWEEAWATKPGSDSDDGGGGGCWSVVRISQLDINGQIFPQCSLVSFIKRSTEGINILMFFVVCSRRTKTVVGLYFITNKRPALPSCVLQEV